MIRYKRSIILKLMLVLIPFAVGVIQVHAQPQEIVPPTSLGLIDFFQRIASLIAPIILLALLAMFLYGGFIRMTAAGDPEKEKQSSQILVAAIVGFIIIVLAPVIINLLGRIIGTGQLIG